MAGGEIAALALKSKDVSKTRITFENVRIAGRPESRVLASGSVILEGNAI
jgi:hypothetical protein